MHNHDDGSYATFTLSNAHNTIQNNICHEETSEPMDKSVFSDEVTKIPVTEINSAIHDFQVLDGVLTDNGDGHSVIYPVYVKQEETQHCVSGDDESMAVEALRQLGDVCSFFGNEKTMCSNCSLLFTHSEFMKHQKTCTSSKLVCTTCGEKFEKKIDFHNHKVCHEVDVPHACRTCGNLFRSKTNLQSHMSQVHHVKELHKCLICGAEFQRPSSLSNHMKIHNYIAGRAIKKHSISSKDPMRKRQEEPTYSGKYSDHSQNNQRSSASTSLRVQTIQNYYGSSVKWPPTTFSSQSHQGIRSVSTSIDQKFNDLNKLRIMPDVEVTQSRIDHLQQEHVGQNPGENSLNLNCSTESEDDFRVEELNLHPNNRGQFIEVELKTSENQQHECSFCGMNFSRAAALVSHEKNHVVRTLKIPIECKFCDNQFQDSNHLASHQITCMKKLTFTSSDLGNSMKWGKHACTECGKRFTTKQKMFRHQWIHRKKTHSCEVCGSQFEIQIQLDKHRLSAHPGDSPFTCSECGKSFVSRQGLWEHGRTHAGSPAHFHCNTCSKTFSSRQGYLIHHRTHTGERPYGCKFCWKAFRDGGTLRKHERIHTGERPHVCPLCSRAFNQKVVLREHVRWVHAAGKNETDVTRPPFSCPLCGAVNQDRDELCAHIVKHSDQMIAEAKAKIINVTAKKKYSTEGVTKERIESPVKQKSNNNELNEQQNFLSIADDENAESVLFITNQKSLKSMDSENDSMSKFDCRTLNHRIINSEDSMGSIMVGRRDDTTPLISAGNQNIIDPITSRDNNISSLLIQPTYNREAIQLLSDESNTLHMITKQNEEFPVPTISNSENNEIFQESIEHIIQDDVETIVQIIDYQNCEDEHSSSDTNCGICGEDLMDKLLLIEHVKTHI